MMALTGARLHSVEGWRVELALDGGFRIRLAFLDAHLARVLVIPPGGLRMPRTWSLSPELSGGDPITGRDRGDFTGFPGENIRGSGETGASLVFETALIRLEVTKSPLALTWQFRPIADLPFEPVLEDRQTGAYLYRRGAPGFTHFLKRDANERYYGFGEKTGDANKQGRRLRMGCADALGYDAETTDPLYKHIPFYLTLRPDRGGRAAGLFYDNLSQGAFDLGQEISAYHGPFRSFEAADGDLDLYVIFGPGTDDVVSRYTALTGRAAFPPRWSLSYSGSSMHYTDAPDAGAKLHAFLRLAGQHDIPCRSFHLSSGYTLRDGKRYAFQWDIGRFPEPRHLAALFSKAGVSLIANIKPALLLDHPSFVEVESFRGFIRDSEDHARPYIARFWGGDAAFLDFTNPRTCDWWHREVTTKLLDHGIQSTWNDNNEYEVWDGAAHACLNGEGAAMGCLRPVQTNLMLRASLQAQRAHAPAKRPFLVSRSGGPGLQRYAQTWTGDNSTDWKTLRYNLRMGHGLSLSGLSNFGHDVGGFAGVRPDAELFMRWIEQGIYWPRFTIHSWNDDGSSNEPWMHPEILPQVRSALHWRERLIPLLYTLLWRAHAHHEPVLRPLFYDFPGELESYAEQDAFMLGANMLAAPVVTQGAAGRSLWLPGTEGGWYDLRDGSPLQPGHHADISALLGAAPVFVRAGCILPLGPSPSWETGPLTLRLFPLRGRRSCLELFDDDGESVFDRASPPCLLNAEADWAGGNALVTVFRSGETLPRWPELRFENEAGYPVAVTLNGQENVSSIATSAIPRN